MSASGEEVEAREAGEALPREVPACSLPARTRLFLRRPRDLGPAPRPGPGQQPTRSTQMLPPATRRVQTKSAYPGAKPAGPPRALEGAGNVSSLWNQSLGRLQKIDDSITTEEKTRKGKPIIHKVIHRPCDRRTSEQRSRQSSALLAANGKLTTANLAWRLRRALIYRAAPTRQRQAFHPFSTDPLLRCGPPTFCGTRR
jgi:hypothetical protein